MTTALTSARWLLISGEWISTDHTFDVYAPYSGDLLATVCSAGRAEADRAVGAATAAMRQPLAPWRRAELLELIADGIDAQREEFAQLICAEAGKPINASRLEATRAALVYRLSAAEARTLTGSAVALGATPNGLGHTGYTMRVPIGVVGAISPFNFPLNLVAHKLAPALAAGCATVLKPAEKTPLTALKLAEVCQQAGLPDGWLNVICGEPSQIGDVLIEDARIAMISFTGSDAVGWGIADRATRKKVALELGNMSPLIVAADADLELAAAKVATHAFGYAGQTCVSVQRVLVEESVLDRFLEILRPKVEGLTVGDPADESVHVGPVIDSAARDRVANWIAEAIDGGATQIGGGTTTDGLLRPTVLMGVEPSASVACREIFGPVCVVIPFAEVDEAFAAANATGFGLQASIFTGSISTGLRATRELQFGSVMINEAPEWRADEIPYGGVKGSGNTKEGPGATVREMTVERLVVIAE
jgi:acyl-CoA reductase-like NAD-dependent aldehyde dehydrogenase